MDKQQIQEKKERLEQIRAAYREAHDQLDKQAAQQEGPADDKISEQQLTAAYQAYMAHKERTF